jgi:hypothetical protein
MKTQAMRRRYEGNAAKEKKDVEEGEKLREVVGEEGRILGEVRTYERGVKSRGESER